jgi:hypothetical protein
MAEMTIPFRKRYKIVLLRGAARRGVRPFLRQTGLILADAVCREKHPDGNRGVIIVARWQGALLGGLLLLRSARTAHAHRYVANPEATREIGNLRVAPSLWLQGALWAKSQGCSWLDVEGFRPIEDKDHPLFNVYEYKRELGPNYVTRIGEYTKTLHLTLHLANHLPHRAKSAVKKRIAGITSLLRRNEGQPR